MVAGSATHCVDESAAFIGLQHVCPLLQSSILNSYTQLHKMVPLERGEKEKKGGREKETESEDGK